MAAPWSGRLVAAAAVFVIAAGLRLGQDLFVPLALAVLFSLVLSPLVRLGQRVVPRAVAVIAVVVLAFAGLAFASYGLVGQVAGLGKKLPEYRANTTAKLDALRGPVARVVKAGREALDTFKRGPEPAPKKDQPVKVEVVEGPDVLAVATAVLGPLMTLGGGFAVVFLLVIFFLLYQGEIHDRVLRLVGDEEALATTRTITEAANGVSRFLFLQACVNLSYGVTLGVGLFALGVPNALLWGVLAALFRFVPYVGPIVAGILPALLAVAVFPGWTRAFLTAGFIVALELVSNNVVEPLVYGKRTGLSPLAVVLAAVVWAWMWGGLGLLLAVPLTVCLVSLGRHVPGLRFLPIIFGEEPPLEPKVQVYQRLLNGRQEEAAELLEKDLEAGKSFAAVCDDSLLGALRMAQGDVRRGRLEPAAADRLLDSLGEIVDDLAETVREKQPRPPGAEPCHATILCLPVGDKADEISARALAVALSLRGCRAKALAVDHTAGETVEAVAAENPEVLVICASPLSNLLRARYLYKRLRRRFGDIPIIEGLWGDENPRAIEGRVVPDHKAPILTRFVEAEERIDGLAREASLRKELKGGAA